MKVRIRRVVPALFALLVLLAGCGDEARSHPSPSPTSQQSTDSGTAGKFVERAEPAGVVFRMAFLPGEQGAKFKVNLYDHGAGVVVGDVNGDGYDDLYFLNQLGANGLFVNQKDGTFVETTRDAGPVALADRICTSAAFNDIDNDGDQDLYVTSTRGGNVMLENDGTGHFRDVTQESGTGWLGHSQGATFFDADNDGDLDLLVTNTARWTTDTFHPRDRYYQGLPSLWDLVKCPVEKNVFFRNDGTGKFIETTEDSGLGGTGWGGDIAVFDYDDDGDVDVFIGNMFGGSILFRNDGKGRFTDVTDEALGPTPWGTVGARSFDFDGDGKLDLYVVDMHSDMWMPPDYNIQLIEEKKKYPGAYGRMVDDPEYADTEKRLNKQLNIKLDRVFFGNGLYRNRGDGTFEEISAKADAETFWPWGIAAGDWDNDGAIDVYLPSGMGFPYFYWPSPVLMNDGNGKFHNRAKDLGVDPPPGGPLLGTIGGKDATRSARSAAVLDVENDGRLDIAVNNFNDRAHLYCNRIEGGAWIAFKLEGTKSNRDAVGAVVRLYRGDRVLVRHVQAAGGYLAQSTKTLYFGLGKGGAPERAEIRWPSGKTQTIETPAPGEVHQVREPE